MDFERKGREVEKLLFEKNILLMAKELNNKKAIDEYFCNNLAIEDQLKIIDEKISDLGVKGEDYE